MAIDQPEALTAAAGTDSWILNSGATTNMCHDASMMKDLQPCDSTIRLGKGTVKARAVSTALLVTELNGEHHLRFSNVLLVPERVANLISMEACRLKGLFYCSETCTFSTRMDVSWSSQRPLLTMVYLISRPPRLVLRCPTFAIWPRPAFHFCTTQRRPRTCGTPVLTTFPLSNWQATTSVV